MAERTPNKNMPKNNAAAKRPSARGKIHPKIKELKIKWFALGAACSFAVMLVIMLFNMNAKPSGDTFIPDDILAESEDDAIALDITPNDELEDISGVSLNGKKIIVDAGHGGSDVGCTGVSGRLEKEVNLEIAQKLQALLEAEGAEVIMTRETDDALAPEKEEDMKAREKIINTSDADMFVSIHQNEFENESATGPQVFFVAQGSVGKRLAVAIQEALNDRLGIASENARMALPAAYRLLKSGSQPSCIVECGFFSNPEEEALLQQSDYQEKLANAVVDGIKLYTLRFDS